MLIEKRIIKIITERRTSDYCKGCENFEPENIVEEVQIFNCSEKIPEDVRYITEHCKYCNICDSLYRRIKR